MIVLGLDTSTSASAVAVRAADGTLSEARDDPPAGAHPGHATRLLELAEELLSSSGLGWADVTRIAVGVGPGTFTGLRVGVASARGLAQSLGIELCGVSSLQALAAPALSEADEQGRAVVAVPLIDARRGEVFAALYGPGAAAPAEIASPRALAPERITDLLASAPGAVFLGCGDGALRHREAIALGGVEIAPPDSGLHLVRAGEICNLAAAQAAGSAYEQVLPDYCREPDAKLALAGGHGAGR